MDYDIEISIKDVKNPKAEGKHFLLSKSRGDIRKLLNEVQAQHCNLKLVKSLGNDTDDLNLHDIQALISVCLTEPNVVHCDWFRDFLTTPSTKEHDNKSQLANQTFTACDFVLQPFDKEVQYVPRRKAFVTDYNMGAGNSLVWTFSFGTSTGMTFTALFKAGSYENDAGTETDIFTNASVKNFDEGASSGTGSFHAPVDGIARLTFDNSSSLFRGNYVEYCVQCVPESTMQAAEKAAADLADAHAHTSALYEALLQSTSNDFFDVRVGIHVADSNDALLKEKKSEPEASAPVSWMSMSSKKALSTIYGIPFAGKLVDTIALSAFNSSRKGELENTAKKVPSVGNNINDNNERATALQRVLNSGDPSDLCTVCGSGSVQDMLCLARQIDALREEGRLEHALSTQAVTAARVSFKKDLAEKQDVINKLKDENAILHQKCSRFEALYSKSVNVEKKHHADMNDLQKKYTACYEKLISLQKEAGVWSVARERVEEELCFLSDSRERDGAERLAAMAQCASLQQERRELLQHIADLEQQQLASTLSTAPAAVAQQQVEALQAQVDVLQAEVQVLNAQKDIDARKLSMLQTEFQEVITSSRSEISQAKMLQYHYQEKLARVKNEKKILVAELRSLRDRGLFSTGGISSSDSGCMKASNTLSGQNKGNASIDVKTGVSSFESCSSNRVKGTIPQGGGADGGVGGSDYCVEKMSELLLRKQLVDETLCIDSENQVLHELSEQLGQEAENMRPHTYD